MALTEEERERYARHFSLAGVGKAGQERLKAARVLLIGAGGLGSPAAFYLAAAGVGEIGIADGDAVDRTNLQRQILHTTADIGRKKVRSASEAIGALNPNVRCTCFETRVTKENILACIAPFDIVLDCTDHLPTKFLINDACVRAKKPFVHAGILRFEGQLMTVLPGTACYRCLFPQLPPKSAIPTGRAAGLFGVLPGTIGTLQATEALKYILGIGTLLTDTLLTYDARRMQFRKVALTRQAHCPGCGAPHPLEEAQWAAEA